MPFVTRYFKSKFFDSMSGILYWEENVNFAMRVREASASKAPGLVSVPQEALN